MDYQENQVIVVHRVILVIRVDQDRESPDIVVREFLGILVSQEYLVIPEFLVIQALEFQVTLEFLVIPVIQESLVILVIQELQVIQAVLVTQENLATVV